MLHVSRNATDTCWPVHPRFQCVMERLKPASVWELLVWVSGGGCTYLKYDLNVVPQPAVGTIGSGGFTLILTAIWRVGGWAIQETGWCRHSKVWHAGVTVTIHAVADRVTVVTLLGGGAWDISPWWHAAGIPTVTNWTRKTTQKQQLFIRLTIYYYFQFCFTSSSSQDVQSLLLWLYQEVQTIFMPVRPSAANSTADLVFFFLKTFIHFI